MIPVYVECNYTKNVRRIMNQKESEGKQLCHNWDTISSSARRHRQKTRKHCRKDMSSTTVWMSSCFWTRQYVLVSKNVSIWISQTCPLLFAGITEWMGGTVLHSNGANFKLWSQGPEHVAWYVTSLCISTSYFNYVCRPMHWQFIMFWSCRI